MTANDDGSAINSASDRRINSDNAQASFLPPIDSAIKGNMDNLENANMS